MLLFVHRLVAVAFIAFLFSSGALFSLSLRWSRDIGPHKESLSKETLLSVLNESTALI